MLARCDIEVVHCAPNPTFKPDQRWSYETVLCRLGGWWTMQESTLTAREVVALMLEP